MQGSDARRATALRRAICVAVTVGALGCGGKTAAVDHAAEGPDTFGGASTDTGASGAGTETDPAKCSPQSDVCVEAVFANGACKLVPANEGASCGSKPGAVCVGGKCTCRTTCGGTCVDIATDAHHCGACGHDCLGGACSAGQCQPFALATDETYWYPYRIAVDATHLYWSAVASGAGKIQKMPLAGGPITQLAYEFAEGGFTIDADYVYWGTSNALAGRQYVHRVAKTGGPVTELAEKVYPRDIVVVGTTLFFVHGNDAIARVPVGGGPVEVTHLDQPQFLTTDGTDVFYSNLSVPGYVARLPDGSASATPLANGREPTRLAVDGTTLYWLSSSALNAVPKSGGTNTTLATIHGLRDLTVDGSFIYMAVLPGGTGAGSVVRVPIAGGSPTTLYTGTLGFGAIAHDARRIYWAAAGAIMAMAK